MEKYTKFQIEFLKDEGIAQSQGIEDDKFVRFHDYKPYYPINIIMIGVTCPNKNYKIFRNKAKHSVIEYITAGSGYVVLPSGKKIKVKKGDFIYLRQGNCHNYFAEPNNPYGKTWVNFESFAFDSLADQIGVTDACVISCSAVGIYFD